MSRRKKKSKQPVSAKAVAESKELREVAKVATVSDVAPGRSAQSKPPALSPTRTRLYLAGALTVVWCLGLFILAATTANPVTVNRKQVLRAAYVVTATVTNSERGALKIEKEWKTAATLKSITVDNLDKTNAETGRTYLIPLSKAGKNQFRVTESDFANRQPLIYPATAEAVEQLKRVLNLASPSRN